MTIKVHSEDGTQLLAALKLLTKVIRFFHADQLGRFTSTLVPALVKVGGTKKEKKRKKPKTR